jgi:hypothetical protein
MISSRDHIKPQRRRRRIEVIPSHLVFLQARASTLDAPVFLSKKEKLMRKAA